MARKVLNELKWHPKKSLEGVKVTYIHRGAPGDTRIINSEEIISLKKSFILFRSGGTEVRLPYHRVTEIKQGDFVLWKKKPCVSRFEK